MSAAGPAGVVEHSGTVVVVGANGSGKSRLGAWWEQVGRLPGSMRGWPTAGRLFDPPAPGFPFVRRIAAQRTLVFPADVARVSEVEAQKQLERGGVNRTDAPVSRVVGDPAVGVLDDYAALVQALFAEQNDQALAYTRAAAEAARAGRSIAPPAPSTLSRVLAVWHELFPHRRLIEAEQALHVAGAVIAIPGLVEQRGPADERLMVQGPAVPRQSIFPGEWLSDGERVGFYLVAHALLAPSGSMLVIDEPELHLHESLQGALWDALESERPDCAFVYLTHDLGFAAGRTDALKILVRAYHPPGYGAFHIGPGTTIGSPAWTVTTLNESRWDWDVVPSVEGLSEDILFRIAGSRRPTLFTEGRSGSVDVTLYRALYPAYDVVPLGSCEAVVRAVRAFRDLPQMHRREVVGVVDPDDRDEAEREALAAQGVHALGFAHAEGVLADPAVFAAVARGLRLDAAAARAAAARLAVRAAALLRTDRDRLVAQRATYALGRRLQPRGRAPRERAAFVEWAAAVAAIDAGALYDETACEFDVVIAACDRAESEEGGLSDALQRSVLRVLRNKGVIELAARQLDIGIPVYLRQAARMLRDDASVRGAVASVVPDLAGVRATGVRASTSPSDAMATTSTAASNDHTRSGTG